MSNRESHPDTLIPVLRGPGGRRLRVAHLTTIDLSLWALLRVELEVDVASGMKVVGLSAPGDHVHRIESLRVEHVALGSLTRAWNPRSDARAGRELLAALRALQLDVLHTHNPKTGVLGRLMGRAARVPVVVNTCHGLWAQSDDRWRRRGAVLTAEAVAAQASHAELYQNAEDRAALSRWVPATRSRVVGNGTDLDHFRPDLRLREQVRSEWGVPDDVLIVGGVGRLVAEKGLAEFADAARRLAGHARFVWVGPEDPDKPDALRGALDGVELLGMREDMAAVYNALDIFVLPSYREGFSRSAMEAAATGLPLVLSDIRGCREIGRHEREVLLVPEADAGSLTTAVARLIDDEPLRRRLGAAARTRALAAFDQVAIASFSLRTYAAVARRKGLGWTVEHREWDVLRKGSDVQP